MIDGQVQAGQAEHGHHDRDGRLRIRAGPSRHDQAVGDAHQQEREDRRRQRRRGIPCPARDDRHAVRPRPGHPLGDELYGELEEEQAAQEYQQVPPAAEHDRQRDCRQPEHRGSPAGAGRVDPSCDAGQPWRPCPREEPEHRRVDLIIEPERRGPHRDHDHAGQDDNREDQPGLGGDRDRVRQRRGRTCRAPVARRPPHGGTRRKARRASRRGYPFRLLAQRDAPPAEASPCVRSQLPATRRGSCPRSSARASRARSEPVVRRAETVLSTARSRGP